MESLERKDTNPVPEEPIKSEGMVPSPSTSDRSNSAGSPPPHCSICLGKLINTSFTDSCLHQFCFTCLLQWSKIKTECPLCKQTFKSIIHNVRSEGDYDQYDVNLQAVAATLDVAVGFAPQQWEVVRAIDISPINHPRTGFMYRTTMGAHHHPVFSRHNPLLNSEAVARREQIPSHAPQVSRDEIRRRSVDLLDFRRQVYRQGTWATELPDAFGRFRESSAEYYRRHPQETHRLIPWLNRELQVLLNNNRSHIAYVMNIIIDSITRYDIRTPSFRNVIRPYFGILTDQFVHEFSTFARTNFDMVGYDQSVVYQPQRGLSNEYAQRTVSPLTTSTSDSDSDSDVLLVENENGFGLNTFSVGPHIIDMPGPSTVGNALRLNVPSIIPSIQMPPVIYTISSSSSESEGEVEVIGYVKPRHERTPEIIDLDSSENEANFTAPGPSMSGEATNQPEAPLSVVEEVVPGPSIEYNLNLNRRGSRNFVDEASRCCMYNYEYFSSSSEHDIGESDSDYNPQSKSRRKKKTSKSSPRKARSRKHKKSTGTPRKRTKSRRDRSYSEAESETTDMPSTSRGTKRYISDHSESEKLTKKSRKNKKAKSSKKSRKTKSKTPRYIEYSSCTSSMSSDSEHEARLKKKEEEKREEEEERQEEYKGDSRKYPEEAEEPRYPESECSSRLRIDENSHSSDEEDDDDDEYPKRKVKSVVASAPVRDNSDSSESEHSASTKAGRGRYRSHKKRKDGKKRRRSRSNFECHRSVILKRV